jgi:hypothetical protein
MLSHAAPWHTKLGRLRTVRRAIPNARATFDGMAPKIARGDVANFMAAALTDGNWVRARPALAY